LKGRDEEYFNESESEKVEKKDLEENSIPEENVDDLNKDLELEKNDKTKDNHDDLQLPVSYEDEINMTFKNAIIRDNINIPFDVRGVGTFYSTKVS